MDSTGRRYKLMVSYMVGKPQITTMPHKPYLKAVEEAFGGEIEVAGL